MNTFDYQRAQRNHPNAIVFTVIKDGVPKLIVVDKDKAKLESKTLPGWTMADLDGCTVRVK